MLPEMPPTPQQSVSVFSQGSETNTSSLISTHSRKRSWWNEKKKKQSMRQTSNVRQTMAHTYRKLLRVRLWRLGSNKRNVATQKMAQQMWPFAPSTSRERWTLRKSFSPTTSFSDMKSCSDVTTALAFTKIQRDGSSFRKYCAIANIMLVHVSILTGWCGQCQTA